MTGKAVDNEAELYGRLWEDWAARWIKDKEEKTGNLHKEQRYIYRMFRENKEKQAALLALKPEESGDSAFKSVDGNEALQ